MSYLLASTEIRRPNTLEVGSSTQYAQNRALDGSVGRDYFGSDKRVWKLTYETVNPSDYSTINTIYRSYLTNGVQTWEITESNYTISQTNVHVDLVGRGFSVKGTDYLSDFDLILTEA